MFKRNKRNVEMYGNIKDVMKYQIPFEFLSAIRTGIWSLFDKPRFFNLVVLGVVSTVFSLMDNPIPL